MIQKLSTDSELEDLQLVHEFVSGHSGCLQFLERLLSDAETINASSALSSQVGEGSKSESSVCAARHPELKQVDDLGAARHPEGQPVGSLRGQQHRDDSPKSIKVEVRKADLPALTPPPPWLNLQDEPTSVVVYNVPWVYSQDDLVKEWSLTGKFDFFQVPFSVYLGRIAGVAIINFLTHELASEFIKTWHGQKLMAHTYKKALAVTPARWQGRHLNLCTVQEETVVLPQVYVGEQRLSDKQVARMIQLAKSGVILYRV